MPEIDTDTLMVLLTGMLGLGGLRTVERIRGAFNPQLQTQIKWPATFTVAKAYLDQLERGQAIPASDVSRIRNELNRLETISAASTLNQGLQQLAASLDRISSTDARRLQLLKETVTQLRK